MLGGGGGGPLQGWGWWYAICDSVTLGEGGGGGLKIWCFLRDIIFEWPLTTSLANELNFFETHHFSRGT